MQLIRKSGEGRVGLIDEARGFAILCMVVYHGFYDLVYIFGVDIPLFDSPLVNALQVIFAGLFIFISGSACAFSHSNFKRGLLCFGLGMVMTAGTALFMPEELILFGILHMLGVCMMLYPPCGWLLHKLPDWAGIGLLVLLFWFTYPLMGGTVGFPPFWELSLPRGLYELGWLSPLGFYGGGFFSADYFPLFPWLFLFLLGSYLGKFLKTGKGPRLIYATHSRFLAAAGRNTLVIYVLHQPVVYGILWVVFAVLGQMGVYGY